MDKSVEEDTVASNSASDSENNSARQFSIYHDTPRDMTYARRIARSLAGFGLYNPSGKHDETSNEIEDGTAKTKPSLDKGWEFFEHVVLPRCLKPRSHPYYGTLQRAEPGEHEKETMLYPIWSTPMNDMADFGIGVGLYFRTVQFLCIVTFIAGMINIPNMIYLSSDRYSNDEEDTLFANIKASFGMKGSAVCSNTAWQPCPDCTKTDWPSFPSSSDRTISGESDDGTELNFILKNNCTVDDIFGIVNIASIIFLVGAVFYFVFSMNKVITRYDEAEQTTADYSIMITNPPKDAGDTAAWKRFFEKNFTDAFVASCTIDLENEPLLKVLVHRKELLRKLYELLDENVDGSKLDVSTDKEKILELCDEVPKWKKLLCCCAGQSAETIVNAIQKLDSKIEELSSHKYDVGTVFVTFETEAAQHHVLDMFINKKGNLDERFHFQGQVLKVKKPVEPSAVRWQDLNDSLIVRSTGILITTLIAFALILGGGLVIALSRRISAWHASIAITVFNTITPLIVRILTSYESHPEQGSMSSSKYLKVTAFRWFNTAIIIQIITPFADTLRQGSDDYLLESVFVLFFFDLFTRPVLQLVDLWGTLCRHVFAPRAKDQTTMNVKFAAGELDIGDLYTEVTRIFFFLIFYVTLFPAAFWYAFAIFCSCFWLDKFSILRSRRQGPKVGTAISRLSNYFFLLCVLVYSVVASYNYAQFPFDNACKVDNYAGDDLSGTYTLSNDDTVEVTGDGDVYQYCNQELIRFNPAPYPATSAVQLDYEWMSEGQAKFADIFGWFSIIMFVIVAAAFLFKSLSQIFASCIGRGFKPRVKPSDVKFSNAAEIYAYVPQVKIGGFAYPFLLCDVDRIDHGYVGWNDPYNGYDHHNMIFDVPRVAQAKTISRMTKEKIEDTTGDEIDSTLAGKGLFSFVDVWTEEDRNEAEVVVVVEEEFEDDPFES